MTNCNPQRNIYIMSLSIVNMEYFATQNHNRNTCSCLQIGHQTTVVLVITAVTMETASLNLANHIVTS